MNRKKTSSLSGREKRQISQRAKSTDRENRLPMENWPRFPRLVGAQLCIEHIDRGLERSRPERDLSWPSAERSVVKAPAFDNKVDRERERERERKVPIIRVRINR